MCFSSNAIELQAYSFTEKIRKNSSYRLVRVDFIGDRSLVIDSDCDKDIQSMVGKELPLITNVILEDESGEVYSIEPNENGVRFASGEICHREYIRLRTSGIRKLLFYTIGSIGVFSLSAWSVISYL